MFCILLTTPLPLSHQVRKCCRQLNNKLRARMSSHILFYEGEAMHNVQNRLVANAA